jgi:DNA-binding GntR family transcriptional regulator
MEAHAAVGLTRSLRRRSLTDEVRERIAQDLILNDAVPPGQLLPSELELSARYGVSRVTLRAGLRALQQAGLITIRHGVGSVVLARSRAVTHGLDALVSLESLAKDAGEEIGTEELEWDERPAGRELATRLEVREGHPVLSVRRVKTLGGTRVGWILDHVPEGIVPFDVVRREFRGSILDVLLAHDDVGVEYEDTNIEPVNLPPRIARRLGVRNGTAALHMDGVTWTARGDVAEVAETWLLPEHFMFSIRRRRQVGP